MAEETTKKCIYVVEALRWGCREFHSYIVGVYSNLEAAKKVADEHTDYRGGKYVCTVSWCNLDEQMDSDMSAHVLYQSKDSLNV